MADIITLQVILVSEISKTKKHNILESQSCGMQQKKKNDFLGSKA